MKARIERKILGNKNHPKRSHLVRLIQRRIETYGRVESRRLGLEPKHWGRYTLKWPASIRELMIKIR